MPDNNRLANHGVLTPHCTFGSASGLLALEPRILFDAAALAVSVDVISATGDDTAMGDNAGMGGDTGDSPDLATDPQADQHFDQQIDELLQAVSPAATTEPTELVFIDERVPEFQTLLDAIPTTAEIIRLDPTRDGIEQIGSILSQYDDVAAIHIISHGDIGTVQLGSTILNAASIQDYATSLQQWNASLTESADILLYGCRIGGTDDGAAFVSEFADYTEADIAASDNLTGDAAQSGDWLLELETGTIETAPILSGSTLDAYDFTLASVTWDGDAGNGDWFDPLNWSTDTLPTAGDDVIIGAGNTVTYNGTSTIGSLSVFKSVISFTGGSLVADDFYSTNNTLNISAGMALQVSNDFVLDGGTTLFDTGSSLTTGALTVTGGTHTFNNDSISPGNLYQSNGAITGSADIIVDGAFEWLGGWQSGTGATTVNGQLILAGSTHYLDTRTLVNASATSSWTSGQVQIYNGALFQNTGTLTVTAGNAGWYYWNGDIGTFQNDGNLIIDLFDTTNTATIDVTFNNTGSVELVSGILNLSRGGDYDGAVTVDASGQLRLSSGDHVFNSGSVLGGTGTIALAGGTSLFNATSSLDSTGLLLVSGGTHTFNTGSVNLVDLTQTNGIITGSADITVTGTFLWLGGIQRGNGTTTVADTGRLLIDGPGNHYLDTRTLINAAPGSAWNAGMVYVANGALFQNTGTLTISADSQIWDGWTGDLGAFRNDGDLIVNLADSASIVTIDVTFYNTGSIDEQNGTLVLTHIGDTNLPPVANDDPAVVDEGQTVSIDLAGNDSDADDGLDLSSIGIVSGPAFGSLVVHADGTVDYTHDGSENFSDSFTYTIRDLSGAESNIATVDITINPVNDAPLASDDPAVVDEGQTVTIDLAGNDSDADDGLDLSSIGIVSGPAFGSLVVNADGTVDYTHDGSENFSDSFTYTIRDLSGAESNIATVDITINPVNDAPVIVNNTGINVDEGGWVIIDSTTIDIVDPEGDFLNIKLDDAPQSGFLAILPNSDPSMPIGINQGDTVPENLADGTDGVVAYFHDGSAGTLDSFQVTADDGNGGVTPVTVTITINPVSVEVTPGPGATEGNASTITLSATGNVADSITEWVIDWGDGTAPETITGTPDEAVHSYVHFGTYEVTATAYTSAGPVSSDTTSVAVDKGFQLAEDDTLAIGSTDGLLSQPLAGEWLPELLDGPDHGDLVYQPDGSFEYIPDPDFAGNDQFTYTLVDTTGNLLAPVTISFDVSPVADAPRDIIFSPSGAAVTTHTAGSVTVIDLSGEISNGMKLGEFSVLDPDANDSHTYTLSDDADGRFALGSLVVADAERILTDGIDSYNIVVSVTDSSGLQLNETFSVELEQLVTSLQTTFRINDTTQIDTLGFVSIADATEPTTTTSSETYTQDDALSVSEVIQEFQDSDTTTAFDVSGEDISVSQNPSSMDVAAMQLAILSGTDPADVMAPPAAGTPQETGAPGTSEPGGLTAELSQMREAFSAEQQVILQTLREATEFLSCGR